MPLECRISEIFYIDGGLVTTIDSYIGSNIDSINVKVSAIGYGYHIVKFIYAASANASAVTTDSTHPRFGIRKFHTCDGSDDMTEKSAIETKWRSLTS